MVFNSPIDIVLFVIELLACISFASSGAIVAIRKKADILGVIILTLISIFGGGIFRDLFINQGAPHLFWDPEYLIMAGISIVVASIWFVLAYNSKTAPIIEKHRHDLWIYILDAIGIASFCIAGARTAYASLPGSVISESNIIGQYIYVSSLGVITGVGGGMFRDIFVGEIPMVFKKHFYMTPCIIGSIMFTIMYTLLPESLILLSVLSSLAVMIALRVLATIYKWNLPSAKGYNSSIDEQNKK